MWRSYVHVWSLTYCREILKQRILYDAFLSTYCIVLGDAEMAFLPNSYNRSQGYSIPAKFWKNFTKITLIVFSPKLRYFVEVYPLNSNLTADFVSLKNIILNLFQDFQRFVYVRKSLKICCKINAKLVDLLSSVHMFKSDFVTSLPVFAFANYFPVVP